MNRATDGLPAWKNYLRDAIRHLTDALNASLRKESV